ncbi:hypothetical protein KGM_213650 [Danaus plexippus plexippus]|uniref:Uncharacterized protein n=1 Tax=Danaus plexippus plexippus TaxID=278856 RepID=A0A212ES37_DANPL|nr:hypothetical protein KGM_213650 [Danaus plexippus plexippus]
MSSLSALSLTVPKSREDRVTGEVNNEDTTECLRRESVQAALGDQRRTGRTHNNNNVITSVELNLAYDTLRLDPLHYATPTTRLRPTRRTRRQNI